MPARRLPHVLEDCLKTLRESRRFASDAQSWSQPNSQPHISRRQHDWIIELAFLRAFLALESFLEESFILYTVGQTAPRGRAPHRFAFPPSRKAAIDWVLPEGRDYASWDASSVIVRASRFFRDGRPFASTLRGSQAALSDARTIRNAIAHESAIAQEKFENVVRMKLGTLPSDCTVGSFLGTTIPASSPPQSFLELYLDRFEFVANGIVPTRQPP